MIRTELMPHQTQAVETINDKPYAGIFFDFGTGKTLIALALIEHIKLKKILVISTKTAVQSTWPEQIKEHTDFRYAILTGSRKTKIKNICLGLSRSNVNGGYYGSNSQTPVLFLINFDGVKSIVQELAQVNFDLIVVDESTKIKAHRASRTKVICKLGEFTSRRYVMTGFPITERLSDIYAQIKFLDHGMCFGNSYDAFLHKYFVKLGRKQIVKQKSVNEILSKIRPFCVRASGNILKLPPKIYNVVKLDASSEQMHVLQELNDYFQLEFGKVSIDTKYIFTLINKSLQICDGFIQDGEGNLEVIETKKDEALLDLIDEIDVTKNKVIIWCAFLFSVEKIRRLLKEYNPLTLTGANSNVSEIIDSFQNKNSNILITTQKKSSASVTLTSCRHAIFYSNVWSYDERYNAEARIYRKGSEKHKNVVYTDLVVKDTVEERVLSCLKKKKDLIDDLKLKFGGLKVNG